MFAGAGRGGWHRLQAVEQVVCNPSEDHKCAALCRDRADMSAALSWDAQFVASAPSQLKNARVYWVGGDSLAQPFSSCSANQ